MKANELMIGDWVYAIDDNGEKHPCRVNDLEYDYINKCDGFCVDFYGTEYNPEWPDVTFNVEPIPLTPEILEKNGFRYTGGGDRSMMLLTPFDEPGLRYNIYVGLKYKTINVYSAFPNELKNGRWRKHNSVDMEVSGPYVHELQHALRICGIEKEIEL